MSPLVSQLLFLGAVVYFLPYRVIIRPLLQSRKLGLPWRWTAFRLLRLMFVLLTCLGGGWLAHVLVEANRHGPTLMTIPYTVCAFAVMMAGGVLGLIAVHLDHDIDDEAYTTNQMRDVHQGPAGHEMDVV